MSATEYKYIRIIINLFKKGSFLFLNPIRCDFCELFLEYLTFSRFYKLESLTLPLMSTYNFSTCNNSNSEVRDNDRKENNRLVITVQKFDNIDSSCIRSATWFIMLWVKTYPLARDRDWDCQASILSLLSLISSEFWCD